MNFENKDHVRIHMLGWIATHKKWERDRNTSMREAKQKLFAFVCDL